MKLFYKCLMLTVILAVAAPFILKDEAGRPLMSWDRIKMPELATPDIKSSIKSLTQQLPDINLNKKGAEMTAYKWQDAEGIWHYSDELNANVDTQMIKLDADANLVHFNKPDKKQSGSQTMVDPGPVAANSTTAWTPPLGNAADLIKKAKGVNQLAQERLTRQEQLIAEQSR